MANFIRATNANEAWLQAFDLLFKSPDATVAETRSGPTTELLHVTITIKDPRQRWVFARQPVINPAFALAEAIWIVSGRNDSGVLNFFNRDLPKYAGDGPTFYGAYGHRLRHQHGIDQLEAAYQSLETNRITRQVVLQIWDAQTDLPDEKGRPRSPDIPCNTQSMLRVQGGKLHWLQTMRSNDIFRGLPYNFVQFTTLHEVMAGWLGLELGDYTHVVSCLHYYHEDRGDLEKTRAVTAVSNTDSLLCSKNESDMGFAFLSTLISGAGTGAEQIANLAAQLDSSDYPTALKNIGNVILADAARRYDHLNLASHRLSQLTNPCLLQLAKDYSARFADMNDQR
jgi:thymidylate synthase